MGSVGSDAGPNAGSYRGRCLGGYVGRFAPSPTGPLHAGSVVAALGSWLDARAHHGRWLVRMEDVDTARCNAENGHIILRQLANLGLHSDQAPWWQSTRSAAYQSALQKLVDAGWAYPCACSRRDIAAAHAQAGRVAQPHHPLPYPGTCREGLAGRPRRAWRFACEKFESFWPLALSGRAQAATFFIANRSLHWQDRRLGAQSQNVSAEVGDFVLKRADGAWAYQLAVVVDDAAQCITHIVRGADLADNTPRQLLLQAALGFADPTYLHTPLVLAADGAKLSKQHGALAVNTANEHEALATLQTAAAVLGLPPATSPSSIPRALAFWVAAWGNLYNRAP